MAYLFRCFRATGESFQVTAATVQDAFATALAEGAARVIDGNGWVYVYDVLRGWTFGTSLWIQVAGSRAGGQHFSLLEPPP